ncbi:MAG: hypothetical protein ABSB28_06175 [Candidatus Bathyarchaeia archaeon]
MSLGSKLRIESWGMFATSVFYAIVGIAFLALLPLSGFPPHVGILGILSLIAAYGMFRKRAWSFWFIIILFFTSTTFSSYVIYSVLTRDYLLGVGMIFYLILTWVFTAYAANKRKVLEE